MKMTHELFYCILLFCLMGLTSPHVLKDDQVPSDFTQYESDRFQDKLVVSTSPQSVSYTDTSVSPYLSSSESQSEVFSEDEGTYVTSESHTVFSVQSGDDYLNGVSTDFDSSHTTESNFQNSVSGEIIDKFSVITEATSSESNTPSFYTISTIRVNDTKTSEDSVLSVESKLRRRNKELIPNLRKHNNQTSPSTSSELMNTNIDNTETTSSIEETISSSVEITPSPTKEYIISTESDVTDFYYNTHSSNEVHYKNSIPYDSSTISTDESTIFTTSESIYTSTSYNSDTTVSSSDSETDFLTEESVTTESSTIIPTTVSTEAPTTTCSPEVLLLLDVKNKNDSSITISWNAVVICSENYYFIVSWVNAEISKSSSRIESGNEFTIPELNSCTEYTISVQVLDETGLLEEKSTLERTDARASKPPEYESDDVYETSIVLSWTIQDEDVTNACTVDTCTVFCEVSRNPERPGLTNGTGVSNVNSSNIVTVTVEGLSPYAEYRCVAFATTENIDSELSLPKFVTTLEGIPPTPDVTINVKGHDFINVMWTISDVPGNLSFIINVTFINSQATRHCLDNPYTHSYVAGCSERNYVIENLQPYSNYEIIVTAATNVGESKPISKIVRTDPYVSDTVGTVNHTIVKEDSGNWKAVLMWDLPCHTNGILKHFNIFYKRALGTSSYSGTKILNYTQNNCCEIQLELQPNFSYNVNIAAVVDEVEENSNNSTLYFECPGGIPNVSSQTDKYFKADPYATSAVTQTLISFARGLFHDNLIDWYAVIVAQQGKEEPPSSGLYYTKDEIKMNSWRNATVGDIVTPYRASPEEWNPFGDNSNEAKFTLGDGSCYETSEYCNGPLKPETTYVVRIRAFTGLSKGGYQDSGIITFTTGSEVAVGMIVGILLAIIILGLVAILIIMYRRGKLAWPPPFCKGAKQVTVRPQPILLKKFPSYCAQLLDTPTRLSNEYQLLATLSADVIAVTACNVAKQHENRKKNRYINILPYDSTRVTLDILDSDPTSHYINASFIKGYTDDIEYIATQGPKEETCYDFWRMVYQHDVRVIVMVTNLIEQDKVKCHQYYPNLRENLVFEDITVRCTTEINFPIHTARTLVLIKGDRKRTISHLYFREWPDFGVPQSTDFMIQFCQTMRHHAMAAELGLILVHCSAGVGRTGTLIAIDILLQHISENKKVDIFGTVYKLRKQRMNMVQTEGQYTYIYRCIKDAVEDPTIVNQRTTTNNSLEPIYENVGTTLNNLQYEKLPKWKKNKTNNFWNNTNHQA